jgi:ABC-type Zn2+ transport system substrate-binding protein/surface adhesin
VYKPCHQEKGVYAHSHISIDIHTHTHTHTHTHICTHRQKKGYDVHLFVDSDMRARQEQRLLAPLPSRMERLDTNLNGVGESR